jgi:uncharacterized protein (DUF2141 family)
MRLRIFTFALFLTLCGLPLVSHAAPVTTRIHITGADRKGVIRLALFNNEKAFDKRTDATVSESLYPDAKGEAEVEVSVPAGSYAIAVFLDEDEDNELDANFIGLPVEKFGFSGHMPRFGPPDFSEASVNLPSDLPVAINLQAL